MGITEIIILVVGAVLLAAGFFLPQGGDSGEESMTLALDEIKRMADQEFNVIRLRVTEMTEETVDYSMEKSERAMERITNEKIMAINEYADTVLSDIEKAHKEVVFLYDMLNDKEAQIKDTAMIADRLSRDVKEHSSEIEEALNVLRNSAKEARKREQELARTLEEMPKNISEEYAAAGRNLQGASSGFSLQDSGQLSGASSGGASLQQYMSFDDDDTEDSKSSDADDNIAESAANDENSDFISSYAETMDISQLNRKKRYDSKSASSKTGRKSTASRSSRSRHIQGQVDAEKDSLVRDIDMSASVENHDRFVAGLKPVANLKISEETVVQPKGGPSSADIPVSQGISQASSNKERVLEMYRAGEDPRTIARTLEMGIGEVQLIIGLYK